MYLDSDPHNPGWIQNTTICTYCFNEDMEMCEGTVLSIRVTVYGTYHTEVQIFVNFSKSSIFLRSKPNVLHS
jgi:hypothetical protein